MTRSHPPTTTASPKHQTSSSLVTRHRPGLVVADLGSGFVDRTSSTPVVVVRDLASPVRLHLDPTMSATQRLALGMGSVGVAGVRGTLVFLPLPADIPSELADSWCRVTRRMGARPVVVQRPIAAAAALGLEMPGRSHLMIEAGEGTLEVSVVVDGVITASRLVRASDGGWRTVLETVARMLNALDPDEELDIRDAGLHAYGPDVHQTSFLAEMSGLAIAEPVGDELTVVLGTRMIARETMGWLPTVR